MQFKSLSYGHFPLNLLGMSARRHSVRARTAPRQIRPECPVRAPAGAGRRGFAAHGDRQRARAAAAPARSRRRIGLSRA